MRRDDRKGPASPCGRAKTRFVEWPSIGVFDKQVVEGGRPELVPGLPPVRAPSRDVRTVLKVGGWGSGALQPALYRREENPVRVDLREEVVRIDRKEAGCAVPC